MHRRDEFWSQQSATAQVGLSDLRPYSICILVPLRLNHHQNDNLQFMPFKGSGMFQISDYQQN